MKNVFTVSSSLSVLLCSFAFPMAELLYDNDDYLSLSGLRKMEGMKEAALYSVDPLPSPELIFDLGEPIKRVKTTRELPQNEAFGLLVNDTLSPMVTEEFIRSSRPCLTSII